MNLATFAIRNVGRTRLRSVLTVLATGVGVLTFVLLQTTLTSWRVAVDNAAHDRVARRHKLSFFHFLPKSYIDHLRQVPGVKAATFATWFGGKAASDPQASFASLAVDAPSFLQVYSEMTLPPEQRARWLADKQGAIVGDLVAKRLNLHVGDRVTLSGTIYPGDWQFTIDGIAESTRRSTDRTWFLFHWDRLNESVGEKQRDQLGWMVSQVTDASQAPAVTAAIDRALGAHDIPTQSMSERAMNVSFLSGASVILETIRVVSLVILGLLMLIVGNTIAMSVRERSHEYGVLRAMGFGRGKVRACVAGEGVVIGLCGALIGLALSFSIVQSGIGGFIEENMGGVFPSFRIAPSTAALAVLLPIALAAVASLLPAYAVSRLSVVDSLRRTE